MGEKLLGIVALILGILKVVGLVDWSWFTVVFLSLIYGGVLVAGYALGLLLIYIILEGIDKIKTWGRK